MKTLANSKEIEVELENGLKTEDLMSFSTGDSRRNLVAEHVRRWGCCTSVALLDPLCKIFSVPDLEGIIGFRTGAGCSVAFGDPVCPPEALPHLTQAFHEHCSRQGWNVIYASASEKFANWAMKGICSSLVEVGEELILDPQMDPKKGAKGRNLRNKISHARHYGVSVSEHVGNDEILERAIEEVSTSWLQARRGPQIYLANIHLFADRLGKRWFYAKQNGSVVGVLLLNRLEARNGWLLNLLMATPEAPNGTTELLISSMLEKLQIENCQFLSFGMAPLNELGAIIGLGPFSTWIARKTFKIAMNIFHLNGRKKYLKKFQPQNESSYVLFSRPRVSLKEIFCLMKALNVSL